MHIAPFIPHIFIITFGTEFSRNSHISEFHSHSSPNPSPRHYVFTLLIGFARISGSSPVPVGGATAPFAPCGDANDCFRNRTLGADAPTLGCRPEALSPFDSRSYATGAYHRNDHDQL